MNAATIHALEAINRAFYDTIAAEFSRTRQAPWPGWARVVSGATFGSVLDVGCGNGRFLDVLPADVRYTGVDSCAALLEDAARRGAHELIEADLWSAPWGERRFDLVVCFGVLHHVPGGERRRELVRRLAHAVTPAGRLVITAWRFTPERELLWSRAGLTNADVEPGDYLLPFGKTDAIRYAHLAPSAEIEGWIEASGLTLADDFEADGRDGTSNRYLVLTG